MMQYYYLDMCMPKSIRNKSFMKPYVLHVMHSENVYVIFTYLKNVVGDPLKWMWPISGSQPTV